MEHCSGIEAYPVGLLANIKQGRLIHSRRYLVSQLKAKNWKAIRNHLNGYLAEWHYCPEGVKHYRCGRGWTKRAAIRRLGVHIAESNLID